MKGLFALISANFYLTLRFYRFTGVAAKFVN